MKLFIYMNFVRIIFAFIFPLFLVICYISWNQTKVKIHFFVLALLLSFKKIYRRVFWDIFTYMWLTFPGSVSWAASSGTSRGRLPLLATCFGWCSEFHNSLEHVFTVVKIYIGIKTTILDLDDIIDSCGEDILLEAIKIFFLAVEVKLDLVISRTLADTSVLIPALFILTLKNDLTWVDAVLAKKSFKFFSGSSGLQIIIIVLNQFLRW